MHRRPVAITCGLLVAVGLMVAQLWPTSPQFQDDGTNPTLTTTQTEERSPELVTTTSVQVSTSVPIENSSSTSSRDAQPSIPLIAIPKNKVSTGEVFGVSETSTTSTSTTTTVAETTTSSSTTAVASTTIVASTTTSSSTTAVASQVSVAPILVGMGFDSCAPKLSWSGASPDTGLYSVQFVAGAGSSFDTYLSYVVHGSSVTLPRWFSANTTYQFRVYTMRSDWDGVTHGVANVTSHSNVVSMDIPSCPATATATTVALTCAAGGTCVLGDTGPGGGVVFYVAAANFTSTGSDCNTACKYLESEPTTNRQGKWCSTNTGIGATAQSSAIGGGMSNTNAANATCTSDAIRIALDFTRNGKGDWHLPSFDELQQLYNQRDLAGIGIGSPAKFYWSSTETTPNAGISVRVINFSTGATNVSMGKTGFTTTQFTVVRAFG